jgi:hypothetical protein
VGTGLMGFSEVVVVVELEERALEFVLRVICLIGVRFVPFFLPHNELLI